MYGCYPARMSRSYRHTATDAILHA
uniref:Uncharacterized protein n=1 Tax=Anguilla anguilla TaxID=7936 RepID=A0A0E9QWQ4_ANGAN